MRPARCHSTILRAADAGPKLRTKVRTPSPSCGRHPQDGSRLRTAGGFQDEDMGRADAGADAGIETRLRKRLRSGRSPQAADDGGHGLGHADMDPRLMTERQQLAFLLRATAADASSSSSDGSSASGESDTDTGGSSDEEFQSVFEQRAADGPRPRGLRRLRRAAEASRGSARTKRSSTRRPAADAATSADRPVRKAADADADVDMEQCALCGGRPHVDATAALFLCAACDRKYPTQQALGRACAA